jgi:hypothetical protein
MPCDCAQCKPIELDRRSITRRINESPTIRTRLVQLGKNPDLRLHLFRCPECGQFWQSGHEHNFGDREYLFQIPTVDVEDWLREPFQQPAAMMIYSAAMEDFVSRASFEPTELQCRAEGCPERAIRFTVFCRKHHIASLQQTGRLPKDPVGRMFPPYYVEPPEKPGMG